MTDDTNASRALARVFSHIPDAEQKLTTLAHALLLGLQEQDLIREWSLQGLEDRWIVAVETPSGQWLDHTSLIDPFSAARGAGEKVLGLRRND